MGRIVREIELREVGDGRIVLNNSLAIPRTYKTDNGPETDFINFVVWGKKAELIEEYCDKGNLIGLDGRIQSRNYQNEDGQTIYVVEMLVDSVHFLQSRNTVRRRSNQRSMTKEEAAQNSRNQNQAPNPSEHSEAIEQQGTQTITERISQSTNKKPIRTNH